MSKGKQAEIELPSIRKPLEPVGKRVTKKHRAEYARLLAEYERIDEIRDSQVKGASLSFDKEKKSYTVREYKALVKSYRAARALYNERYAGRIETIEMVRAKLERLDEEAEKFCKEHPEQDLPDLPEMEDAPDESWDEFRKRLDEFSEQLKAWNEAFAKSSEINLYNANRLKVRLEEMNKFPQLEYELEMRLRHTYIDPKTGEHQYRPDDDVGEGLICVGSRDHNPVLKDE